MKFARWILLLSYAILIFILSTSSTGGKELFLHADKIIHFLMYAILAGLCVWVFNYTDLASKCSHLVFSAALVATAYGAFIEFVQGMIPYRSFEVGDIFANALGAIVGAFIWVEISKRKGALQ